MVSNVKQKFESLTMKRDALLQKLSSLSTEELNFKASPDKWTT
jgi:hypothetical protein